MKAAPMSQSIHSMPHLSDLPHPDHDRQFYDGVPVKRLVAWLIDVLVVSILSFVAWGAITIVTLGLGIFLFVPIFFLTTFGYRTLTISANSATPGMQAMGIELRTRTAERLSLQMAALHTGMFMFLMASGIGWILTVVSILVTRYNQGLPDLVLGTTAINRPADY